MGIALAASMAGSMSDYTTSAEPKRQSKRKPLVRRARVNQTEEQRLWNERVDAEKAAKKLANARAFRIAKNPLDEVLP